MFRKFNRKANTRFYNLSLQREFIYGNKTNKKIKSNVCVKKRFSIK